MGKQLGILVAFILLIVLVLIGIESCNSSKLEYKIEEVTNTTEPKIDALKIYLEASLSMRGFVHKRNPNSSNYKMRTVVPFLITECRQRLGTNRQLFTFITDSPKLYQSSDAKFKDELWKGSILNGGNSRLQNILKHVIDSTKKGELSFLISDCILDLGDGLGLNNLDIITTLIYDKLVDQKDLSVALFKYSSDFNGNYYYCYNNSQPYTGIELKNHPFYIWIFGEADLIKHALSKQVISDFDNSYSWEMSAHSVNPQLIKYPCRGKWIPFPKENKIQIKEISKTDPVTFTIALNLENLPEFVTKEYLQDSIQISKKKSTGASFVVKNRDDYMNSNDAYLLPILDENQEANHFIEVTFSSLKQNTGNIIISLPNKKWLDETHLERDMGTKDTVLPTDSLENRTFSFSYITKAFSKYYGDNDNLFEIKLSQIKN